jgi:hypothetical protein
LEDELKAQVAEFYRKALEAGATEEQALRLSRRFVAEQRADGGPSIGPSGPTAQPTLAKLPPMVGGALDMLIQFGLQGGTFGLAGKMVPAIGEASREIDARNPRTSAGMKAAGAAMAIPMAAAGATVGRAGMGAASALARSRLGQAALGTGLGGGTLLGGYQLLKRLGIVPQ